MKRFQRAANKTSIHGVREICEIKNIYLKCAWSAFLISAFGITAFHIYRGIEQFLDQPSLTSVARATHEEIMFPSITMCSPHWMYWVDWKKVYSMNFTKSMVVYALSFMDNLHSDTTVNISETKSQLFLQMAMNNITTLSQFYETIARHSPFMPDYTSVNAETDEFNSTIKYLNVDYEKLFCCYEISSEDVSRANSKQTALTFKVPDLSYSYVREGVSESEYNHNILGFLNFYSTFDINALQKPKNFTSLGFPWIIYPASEWNYVEIGSGKSWYDFQLSITAYEVKDTPCQKGLKWTRNNVLEEKRKCQAVYLYKTCQCINITDAVLIDEDTLDKTCRNKIIFIGHDENSDSDKIIKNCIENETANQERDKCIQDISIPCQIWQYTFAQRESQLNAAFLHMFDKSSTLIIIYYPDPNEVLITTEINVQTWGSFFASVGGVLGIWTGASVVSCFQLIYLLCTPEYDKQQQSDKYSTGIKINVLTKGH